MANNATLSIVLKAIDQASGVINKVNTSAGKLKSSFKDMANQIPGLNTAMSLMTNPLTLVGVGVFKAAQFTADATRETVKYAEQVRDLSRALGTNATEASTLLQIADDLKIETTQLEMAFRNAINKGVSPTVDGLKDLAKEYQALPAGVDRARFAMDKFGSRAGLEMQKVLELTTDQIDAMAKSAKNAGLVMSDEGVKAAREFEIAADDLDDTFQGLKYTLGNEFIPKVTAFTGALNTNITAGRGFIGALKDGDITMGEYLKTAAKVTLTSYDVADANVWLTDKLGEVERQTNATADVEAIRAKAMTETYIPASDDYTEATQNAAYAIYDVSEAALGKTAIDALNKSYEDGTISTAEYEDKLGFLMTQMLNMDPQAATTTIEMAKLKKEFDEGRLTADQYIEKVYGLYNAMAKLDGTTATITIIEKGGTTYRGKDKEGYATGGDFIVPPGFPNDTYPINVSSGERVTITPAGQTTTNNWNMTINEAGGVVDPVGSFAMMRALAS